jgi:alpha-glucosidase
LSFASGEKLKWWQRAVVYEITPISFQDSDGDGKGDLKGLIARLDHLSWLGVEAVWLTPVYPSPMLDLGYDVSDFCGIDPVYGTLADFDRLVEALHARNIRLILDFVPNHTSDRHAWFKESRSSRGSARRDWYIWADPGPDGGPPNNWVSRFGGSAWEWDDETGQYYYHCFLKEQPDLNWRNPEVRSAMADVLRFWLERGVDGFRVDASAVLAEDALLRDEPLNPEAGEDVPPPNRYVRVFTDDRPESLAYLGQLRQVLDEFPDRVLAGEVQGKTERIGRFYGDKRPCLHLPLNFALIDCPWDALSLQARIDAYMNAVPDHAWPDWVIGGHDKKRIAGRIGQQQARILAMLVMTLKGTPFLFAGDEIGQEQVEIPPERVRDPFEKWMGGYGLDRDPERAPLRWDDSEKGGFTTGEPWLPIAKDRGRNFESQKADKGSLLWLYRRLIELRRREPLLTEGDYQPLRSINDILLFKRAAGREEIFVALNIAHQPRKLVWEGQGRLLLSTCLDRAEQPVKSPLMLRADEGIIVKFA